MDENSTPEQFFENLPLALSAYRKVSTMIEGLGPAEIRTTRSQVAFWRHHGFAYLWLPGRWLSNPGADIVLSIGLKRRLDSPRFKQIVHPSPPIWMHHLEVQTVEQLDNEVLGWLRDAYADAA